MSQTIEILVRISCQRSNGGFIEVPLSIPTEGFPEVLETFQRGMTYTLNTEPVYYERGTPPGSPPPRSPQQLAPLLRSPVGPPPPLPRPAPAQQPIRPIDLDLKIVEKALSKDKVEMKTQDCAICCENHAITDCLLTSCKHLFGKECLQNWHKKTCKQTKIFSKPFSKCPMCREPVNSAVGFRPRAKTIKK